MAFRTLFRSRQRGSAGSFEAEIRINDGKLQRVKARVAQANKAKVAVGIFEGAVGTRRRKGGRDAQGRFTKGADVALTPIAQYMAIHEFGGGLHPEKPWMRSALTVNSPKHEAHLRKGMGRIIDGTATHRQVLSELGLIVQADLRWSITSFGLVDTNAARNSIAWEVL